MKKQKSNKKQSLIIETFSDLIYSIPNNIFVKIVAYILMVILGIVLVKLFKIN